MSKNKKHKVLIVDDDSFLLEMYATKFQENGFEVLTAKSASAALDKLSGDSGEIKLDAVLTDVLMPSMDGLELVRELREKDIINGAKIIILSNKGEQEDIKAAKDLKVDGYIVKASAVPSEVVEKVRSIIEER